MKTVKNITLAAFLLALTILLQSPEQLPSGAAAVAAAVAPVAEEGIPITNELIIDRCGKCHERDTQGRMTRISYIRTTPEIWQQILKRMIRLNGLVTTPDEMRQMVKYLSNNHGLAPEEAKGAFWEVEHRVIRDQEDMVPDKTLNPTCTYCHTIGRVLSQRRTREDYELLANMHVALFPGSETAVFRPRRAPAGEQPVRLTANGSSQPSIERAVPATAPDPKYPIENALDYLAKSQPLITPEWSAWSAKMRTPKLAGRWLLIGSQKGKGKLYGEVVIEQSGAEDEFTTKISAKYAADGTALTRTGKGIVYTGYSWRGRSQSSGGTQDPKDPGKNPAETREAMFISRDSAQMEGRWFWGGYDEFGIDVTLYRLGAQPVILGVDRGSLKSPSASEVRIYGGNLPTDLKPEDIDFGPGVKVKRIVSAAESVVAVEVEVAPGAARGMRDLTMRRSFVPSAIAVYDKINYIKIAPDAAMGRLGGTIAPKQYEQFDAIAYNSGPDGKSGTNDDFAIGPVEAEWTLEEFPSTPEDDDKEFVGTLDSKGLFTPALEGPNPKRQKQKNNFPTNNWGDVWVMATYKGQDGPPLKAKAYLVVTIPLYVRYDQPEVAR